MFRFSSRLLQSTNSIVGKQQWKAFANNQSNLIARGFCQNRRNQPPAKGSFTKSNPLKKGPNVNIASLVSQFTTIFDVYRYAVTQFTKNELAYGHSTLTPWEDASFLIMHELSLPYRDPIKVWKDAKLTNEEREHLINLIQQRIATRKPTAYIVKGCYQQEEYFYIDERALIPRSYIGEILANPNLVNNPQGAMEEQQNPQKLPEVYSDMSTSMDMDYQDYIGQVVDEQKASKLSTQTSDETKVMDDDLASMLTQQSEQDNQTELIFDPERITTVLDLCTGSGCLAILAAKYLPYVAHIDAVDLSGDALEVAKINVQMKQLEDFIKLHRGDLYAALPKEIPKYDLIISNPPYVTLEEMQVLPPEYKHEPSMALVAGREGLDIIDKLLKKASHYLSDEGILMCEVGHCKEALEEKYPNLFINEFELAEEGKEPLVHWINTEQSENEVFIVHKKYLTPKYLSSERANPLPKMDIPPLPPME